MDEVHVADLADGRLQRRLARQHAIAALSAARPSEPEPRPVVVEQSLDADLPRSRLRWSWRGCDGARGCPSSRNPSASCRRLRPRTRRIRRRPSGRGARGSALSENIWASSDSSCRCCSVACSGTSSTNTCATGLPSGASNGMGDLRRTNAPCASLSPLIRPWGMAMPCPRPVEPSFSRAARLVDHDLARRVRGWSRTVRRPPRTGATSIRRRGRAGCSRPAAARRSGSSITKWTVARTLAIGVPGPQMQNRRTGRPAGANATPSIRQDCGKPPGACRVGPWPTQRGSGLGAMEYIRTRNPGRIGLRDPPRSR